MRLLKKFAAKLPAGLQTELKRIYFRWQIKKGKFYTWEPEYGILDEFIKPGDWVIDIGANVGHYTKRFSELVGEEGRVIAFEPIPITFSLLSANIQLFPYTNVTLINAALSDKLDVVGMSIPEFSTGLTNYYQAHLSADLDCPLSVLIMSLDSLDIKRNVSLVKIDAEGHEVSVLAGMKKLIETFHPVLVVETGSNQIIADLEALGYVSEKLAGSPNVLFRPQV